MEFTVATDERVDVVDVTAEVESALRDAFDEDAQSADDDARSTGGGTPTPGVCTVFVSHTTAGVVLNEAEPRLLRDLESFVADLAPESGWEHDDLDGNADAHLRSMLLGRDVTVPVADGELELGRWQSILLVECDGPRRRTVTVRVH